MRGLAYLDGELAELERRALLRTPRTREELPPGAVLLCSNDYLGFASEPPSPPRASAELASGARPSREAHLPGGAGASALVWGYGEVHVRAERALAAFMEGRDDGGAPDPQLAALMFSSGYAANVGVLSALARRGDRILSDALNHASFIDGCRLSGADVAVVPHLDLAKMEESLEASAGARRRFVVTESCFSMDGDGPDLRALRALCDRHDAILVVDEAHALGVEGPEGRGRAAAEGVRADLSIGTLGKAFGLAGAFVVGPPALRQWLWNRARSFVFSTAVFPSLAAAVPGRALEVRQADDRRLRLRERARSFRAHLAELGWAQQGDGPIVPVTLGAPEVALRASARLAEEGFVVQAIRPPTVPVGTSRLRITLRADLDEATCLRAAAATARTLSAVVERGPQGT